MIGFDDFRLYQIERDEEVIAYMQDFAISFWHNHVIPRVPPEPSTLADVRKLFAKDQGGEVESQPEVADAVLRIKGISEQIKELEKESDALKVYVQAYMRDAAILRGTDGRKLATWKTQTTNRFAQKEFEADHPDLFTQYKKPSLSRVFRLA
jgi:predicted phage-related endonuclease